MKTILRVSLLVVSLAVLLVGCATPPVAETTPLLRVGLSPDYPPIAYKQGAQLAGIEADMARRLGGALNRRVQFVELTWDDLIPALLDGRIDVIMSGMSVTATRQVRVAFSDGYMMNSLVAAVPAPAVGRYTTADDVLLTREAVGVLRGSSADAFVTRSMAEANKVTLERIADARTFFDGKRIKFFIADICAVAWLVSENDTSLAGVWLPLHEEAVGWAFRKDDAELRESANRILTGWKQDGTLQRLLASHVTYLDRIPWQVP